MPHDTLQDDVRWWRAEVHGSEATAASSGLWALGAKGVEVRDGETFFEDDPDFALLGDGSVRVIAFFELKAKEAESLGAALKAWAGWEVVSWGVFEDESWKTKWKEYFRPHLLSPRFRVGPPWEEFEAPEGGWKLVVEPGMAFGTGTHETTQLVAQVIDELMASGAGVPAALLDVGSGSGILSVQAALLGVGKVAGLDIDDESMENAQRNVELNGLKSHDIRFSTTPLAQWPGTYPLVVANILAHILVSLAPQLIAHTAPGGTLVLSGILEDQIPDILEAFAPLTCIATASRGPWFALTMRR